MHKYNAYMHIYNQNNSRGYKIICSMCNSFLFQLYLLITLFSYTALLLFSFLISNCGHCFVIFFFFTQKLHFLIIIWIKHKTNHCAACVVRSQYIFLMSTVFRQLYDGNME